MSNNQTIKERLLLFIEYKGLTPFSFEKACGLSQGFVKNIRVNISPSKLANITNNFNDINKAWLLTGEGSMLNTADATAASFAEVDKREALKADGVVMVPVINLDARGGFGDNVVTDVAQFVEGVIPFSSSVARPGDVVVPMFGDSMYPRFCSGSRLLIRPVESWREFLEFGNSYVIELSDGRRLVKMVKKGSDNEHFLLVSVNPEFEPQGNPVKYY